jgi:hypothetical protein
MIQAGYCARLALKALSGIRLRAESGVKHLDGYSTGKANITGPVNLAHPARTYQCLDLVGTQANPTRESHTDLNDFISPS